MANKLDLADAQFIGFQLGKIDGSNIIPLVESMGLTEKEWKKWKKDYPTSVLTENEVDEIDNYFIKCKQRSEVRKLLKTTDKTKK